MRQVRLPTDTRAHGPINSTFTPPVLLLLLLLLLRNGPVAMKWVLDNQYLIRP